MKSGARRTSLLRPQGVEAFTVFKQGGTVFIRGSNNFNPTVSQATQELLSSLFK